MKNEFRLAIAAILLLLPNTGRAQWLTQTFDLKDGWNAIYLHVDASHTDIVGALGYDLSTIDQSHVNQIWAWAPKPNSIQFIQSPQAPVNNYSRWSEWHKDEPVSSELKKIRGNTAYLVHANLQPNQIYKLRIKGKPVLPRYEWTTSGLNFIGFPTPSTSTTYFDQYLVHSPELHRNGEIYLYNGGVLSDGANPARLFSLRSTEVRRGEAMWIRGTAGQYSNYFGPLKVTLQDPDGVHFGDSMTQYRVIVRNMTSNPITIKLAPVASEDPPAGQLLHLSAPKLVIRGDLNTETLDYDYFDLSSSGQEWSLKANGEPGSGVEIIIGLDRANMSQFAGDRYAGLLRLTDRLADSNHGTIQGMTQIDLQVTATVPSMDGLWVGEALVNEVRHDLTEYTKDDNPEQSSSFDSAYLGNTDSFTIAGWSRITKLPNGGDFFGIVGEMTTAGSVDQGVFFGINNKGRLVLRDETNANTYESSNSGIRPNQWNHVSAVFRAPISTTPVSITSIIKETANPDDSWDVLEIKVANDIATCRTQSGCSYDVGDKIVISGSQHGYYNDQVFTIISIQPLPQTSSFLFRFKAPANAVNDTTSNMHAAYAPLSTVTASAHGYTVGRLITITGAVETDFNNSFEIEEVISNDKFRIITQTALQQATTTGATECRLSSTIVDSIDELVESTQMAVESITEVKYAVNSITETDGIATATTAQKNNLQPGDSVSISGSSKSSYNNTFTILSVQDNTFKFNVSAGEGDVSGSMFAWVGIATAITVVPHSFIPGDWVKITQSSLSNYNSFFKITSVDDTKFTFNVTPGTGNDAGLMQAARATGFAVANIADSHIFEIGDQVNINDINNNNFNQSFIIADITNNTFTFQVAPGIGGISGPLHVEREGDIRFFLNGEEVGKIVGLPGKFPAGAQKTVLGNTGPDQNSILQGDISSLSIYRRSLTKDHVIANYKRQYDSISGSGIVTSIVEELKSASFGVETITEGNGDGVATAVTYTTHDFRPGDHVKISNSDQPYYNNFFEVLAVQGTEFTFNITPGSGPATGQMQAVKATGSALANTNKTHSFQTGDKIEIKGGDNVRYNNISHIVTSVSDSSFKFAVTPGIGDAAGAMKALIKPIAGPLESWMQGFSDPSGRRPKGRNSTFGKVRRPYKLRLLFHRDKEGNTRLLQRVFHGPDKDGEVILSTQESALDPGHLDLSRRMSVVHLPFSKGNEHILCNGTLDARGSLEATVQIAHDNPAANPFVHTYHPDHDNLDPQFENQEDAGRESWRIIRGMRYTFQEQKPEATSGSTMFGSLEWGTGAIGGEYRELITLEGKQVGSGASSRNETRQYEVRGSFALRRLSHIDKLVME